MHVLVNDLKGREDKLAAKARGRFEIHDGLMDEFYLLSNSV
jgi:hypothetical protein